MYLTINSIFDNNSTEGDNEAIWSKFALFIPGTIAAAHWCESRSSESTLHAVQLISFHFIPFHYFISSSRG